MRQLERCKDEETLSLLSSTFEIMKRVPNISVWNMDQRLPHKWCFKEMLHVEGVELWLDWNLSEAVTLSGLLKLYHPHNLYL